MAKIGTAERIEVTFTREQLQTLLDTFPPDGPHCTKERLPLTTYVWVEPDRVKPVTIGLHDNCRDDMTFLYEEDLED